LTILAGLFATCGVEAGFAFGAAVARAEPDPARVAALAESPAWKALLLYVPRWGWRRTSIVDAPDFFLAKTGQTDPAAELVATLEAFGRPLDAYPKIDDHPLCRYPARRALLTRELGLADDAWPKPKCPAQDRWLGYVDVDGISLVFASYFLNNPASLFGHTFLRLHRRADPELASLGKPPAMLDFAVNFAANPTTSNPILYPLYGLAGGFPGTFSLMPYYLKVQEYNNAESRDLWEYRLAFDAAETRYFMQVLWEVGPHVINYFYIDENCSYVMLLLLDALRPELALADDGFLLITTPADTLRAIVSREGLVVDDGVAWRPSSRGRLLARSRALTAEQRRVLHEVVDTKSLAAETGLPALAPAAQAAVLDAALEWIDYDEALAGTKTATLNQAFQDALLSARAKIDAPPGTLTEPPASARPERGPRTQSFALGVGVDSRERSFAQAEWRPTLHQVESPSAGYSPYLQIEIMNFRWRSVVDEEGRTSPLELEQIRLFDALSLAPLSALVRSPSWRFAVGGRRDPHDERLWRGSFEGGGGATFATSDGRWTAYGIGLVEAGLSQAYVRRLYAAPGVQLGLLAEPLDTTRLGLTWRTQREGSGGEPALTRSRLRFAASYAFREQAELRAWLERAGGGLTPSRPEIGIEITVFH
jgi:hypothetical protein